MNNVSANRTRAAAHRFENKCFGVLCTGYLDASNIEAVSFTSSDPKYVSTALEGSSRGATMFLDPTGAPSGLYRRFEHRSQGGAGLFADERGYLVCAA
jgi:nitrilase